MPQLVYRRMLPASASEDAVAPTVNVWGVSNGQVLGKDAPITLQITDQGSQAVSWNVMLIDNATGGVHLLASGDQLMPASTKVATLAVADYTDGSYTLLVEAVDESGNRTEVTRAFSIDTTPPEISILSTDRLETGQAIAFTVATQDASTVSWWNKSLTLNGVRVQLDGNGVYQHTFTEPGEYTLVAKATDAAGNTGTITRVITVTENTDFIAPEVTINSPGANSYHYAQIDVQATIGDVDSDNVSWTVRLRQPNGTLVRVLATGTGMVTDGTIASFYAYNCASGTYEIEVEAIDPAGHTTTVTTSIIISRTATQIVINSIPQDSYCWHTSAKAVTAVVRPGDTPVELLSWTTKLVGPDGREYILANGTGSPSDGVFGHFDPRDYPTDYGYKVVIEAVDGAGRETVSSLGIAGLDGHPPVIEELRYRVEGLVVYAWVNGQSDGGLTPTIALGGNGTLFEKWVGWGFNSAYWIDGETRWIELTATDQAGNKVHIGTFECIRRSLSSVGMSVTFHQSIPGLIVNHVDSANMAAAAGQVVAPAIPASPSVQAMASSVQTDTTPPIVTFFGPTEGAVVGKDQALSLRITDQESATINWSMKLIGNSAGGERGCWRPAITRCPPTSGWPRCLYLISLTAAIL